MPLNEDLQQSLGDAYTLNRELGGGGMSHVFVARDTQLDREVVVKVLPPDAAAALSGDRFRREIALAAKLQHPHIVPLLGAGETAAGLPYYTMPFVEGESLRQRLVREGELSVAETVGILREVTRALSYAHERNVIHRDIKPDNVMLSGGSAMVTDFGVAKAVASASDSAAGSRGTTLTQLGVSLGTPAYMSPEQAAAEPTVDQRTDIYALGCMAYEMLTGQPPFSGRSAASTIAAQVAELPEAIQRRRPNVSPALAALVMQCLEKRPADRPHDARDVLRILDGIVVTPSPMASVMLPAYEAKKRSRTGVIIAGAAIAAALIGIAMGAKFGRSNGAGQASNAMVRFSVPFPEGWELCATGSGSKTVQLSPDGSRLAICAQRADTARIFQRKLDELEWTPISALDDASGLEFSSDGKFILGSKRATLKIVRVPVDGGPISEVASGANFGTGAMGPDGALYVPLSYKSGLVKFASPGATPTPLTTRDTASGELGHWGPQLLPDQAHLLFAGYNSPIDKARILVATTAGADTRTLLKGGSNPSYAAGYLFFAKGDVLDAAPFDLSKLRITAAPQPVLDAMGSFVSNGDAMYSVVDNGTLAYIPTEAVAPNEELVWVDRTGKMTPVLARKAAYEAPRLGPDGRIAMLIRDAGFKHLWVYDPSRETFTSISRHDANTLAGVWSRDGKTIYFGIEDPIYQVYSRSSDASGPEVLLKKTSSDKYATDISADGRTLVMRSSPGGHSHIATMSATGQGDIIEVLGGDNDKSDATLSPDGHWIAFVSNESGRDEAYIRSWPDVSKARVQVSSNGARMPRWTRDGHELVFRSGTRVMSASIDLVTGASGKPVELFDATNLEPIYDITPDGSRFLMVHRVSGAASAPRVVVVTNWVQSLAKKFQ